MAVRDRTEGPTRERTLVIWLVVLGLVVLGLGGWVVYDLFFAPTTAPSAELDQVVDDYIEAFVAADGEAFGETVTSNYRWIWADSTQTADVAEMVAYVASGLNFEVNELGPRVWNGDNPIVVAVAMDLRSDTMEPGPDGMAGVSVLEIVEQGDGYRVSRHVWAGK